MQTGMFDINYHYALTHILKNLFSFHFDLNLIEFRVIYPKIMDYSDRSGLSPFVEPKTPKEKEQQTHAVLGGQ